MHFESFIVKNIVAANEHISDDCLEKSKLHTKGIIIILLANRKKKR